MVKRIQKSRRESKYLVIMKVIKRKKRTKDFPSFLFVGVLQVRILRRVVVLAGRERTGRKCLSVHSVDVNGSENAYITIVIFFFTRKRRFTYYRCFTVTDCC